MAELPQAPVTPQPGETLDYQPVSAWAVAGLLLGAIITLLVLGTFLISVFSGQPVLLPLWTMVIGVAGMIVCLIARRMIQFSEGTLTGASLASWGMWMSVLSVLGFTAFIVSTDQALYQQADAFLRTKEEDAKTIPDAGFFPRLVESGKDRDPVQANCAFLLTSPVNSRAGNPKDDKDMEHRYNIPGKDKQPGRLTQFRQHPLVRLIEATAGNEADETTVTFEPRARVSCVYDAAKRQYVVTRIYHIKTPEVEMDVKVTVNSDEAPEPGVRRRWVVAMPLLKVENQHETPLGDNLKSFRGEVYNQVVRWAKSKPAPPIPLQDVTDYAKLFPDAFLREHIQKGLKDLAPGDMTFATPSMFPVAPWKMADGKLQIAVPAQVTVAGRLAPIIIAYTLDGLVYVESATPCDPHISGTATPDWNIAYVKWTGYYGKR